MQEWGRQWCVEGQLQAVTYTGSSDKSSLCVCVDAAG
jgi:hypothetical protein